jgi:peptidylprolyl isomerase
MNRKNLYLVAVIIIMCGALIGGLSYWLGGTTSSIPLTEDYSEEDLKKIGENLPAPLKAEELEAYNIKMTNETNPVAVLQTNYGTVELELFTDTMPITAGNFIKLAKEGFYDGVKFHRVIENFMIQSGDPNTKTTNVASYGQGGPDYTIPDEHVPGEHLSNVRGSIAMANRGPQSGGSQFFINLVDNTGLDFDKEPLTSKHPVFGQVLSGMEVVDTIGKVETLPGDRPAQDVVIERLTINE